MISTVTRSPGTMRMKFFLILPAMWRQNAVAVFQLDHELGVGQSLDDFSFGSDRFFFGHKDLL